MEVIVKDEYIVTELPPDHIENVTNTMQKEVEETDDLNLQNLLSSFDLEILYSILKINCITFRCLMFLSKEDIEEVIRNKAYSKKFCDKLFAWRSDKYNSSTADTQASSQLPVTNFKTSPASSSAENSNSEGGDNEDALSLLSNNSYSESHDKYDDEVSVDLPQNVLSKTSTKVDVQEILESSVAGRRIKAFYNNGFLCRKRRMLLVRIIIKDVLERNQRLNHTDCLQIFEDILKILPNEKTAYNFYCGSNKNPSESGGKGYIYMHYLKQVYKDRCVAAKKNILEKETHSVTPSKNQTTSPAIVSSISSTPLSAVKMNSKCNKSEEFSNLSPDGLITNTSLSKASVKKVVDMKTMMMIFDLLSSSSSSSSSSDSDSDSDSF